MANIYGELSDWLNPLGTSLNALSPPRGVYALKHREGDHWFIEPGARTRSREGTTNQILSVGGTPEPVLFAPVAPFAFAEPTGGITVTAALRKGFGTTLRVHFAEPDGAFQSAVWLDLWLEEDEHLIFRGRVPTSLGSVRLGFELADGTRIEADETGAALQWTRDEDPNSLPDWWRNAVVYGIFVDRFRAAFHDGGWGASPHDPHTFAGGHLEGIRRSLDGLRELGATVLHLTPIHLASSCHRYDLVDALQVDPALGGDDAFTALLSDAHAKGLRVLLDLSFSHVGASFAPWRDVIERGRASAFAEWFLWNDERTEVRHYNDKSRAPLLNLGHPAVREWVLRAVTHWCEFEIDGFRLDGAAEVPLALAVDIRRVLREKRPSAVVMGEVVPRHTWRWTRAGAVDASTSFGFHTLATALLRDGNAANAAAALKTLETERGGEPATSMRFLSTHDHARFASQMSLAFAPLEAERRTQLGWLLLAALPGVPYLLYGEELALSAAQHELEPENVWANRMPMEWSPSPAQLAHRELVRTLLALRAGIPGLASATLEDVHGEGALLVWRLRAGATVWEGAINLGNAEVTFELSDDALPHRLPLFTLGECTSTDEGPLTLAPLSGVLFERQRPARRARLASELFNRRTVDFSFEQQRAELKGRPCRLDFALTERCNLACRHCITDAPSKTRSRRARTLTPWLIDRLRPDFRFAQAFAFVHGGESLVAPELFAVLRAIAEERAGQNTHVHLLTHGMLLTPRTVDRLVEHGVTSLAISLDGATHASNDSMRVGSDVDRVLANLKALTDRRLPLRTGISTVITRDNFHELELLVERAADAGAEWLKLEELVPMNDSLRQLEVDAEAQNTALAAAAQRANERDLRLIDHTQPATRRRCDPSHAHFFAGDDFANGTPMHPCRLAWELACIEPNGDVRIADFFGTRLGNLADASLESLWQGSLAQSERHRALMNHRCPSPSTSLLSRENHVEETQSEDSAHRSPRPEVAAARGGNERRPPHRL